jgi:hypothetical protein
MENCPEIQNEVRNERACVRSSSAGLAGLRFAGAMGEAKTDRLTYAGTCRRTQSENGADDEALVTWGRSFMRRCESLSAARSSFGARRKPIEK